MAGEVVNMNILDINKHLCKLKDLCFKTATKPCIQRCASSKKNSSCGKKQLYSQDYLRRKIDLRRKSNIFVANYAENENIHTRK